MSSQHRKFGLILYFLKIYIFNWYNSIKHYGLISLKVVFAPNNIIYKVQNNNYPRGHDIITMHRRCIRHACCNINEYQSIKKYFHSWWSFCLMFKLIPWNHYNIAVGTYKCSQMFTLISDVSRLIIVCTNWNIPNS